MTKIDRGPEPTTTPPWSWVHVGEKCNDWVLGYIDEETGQPVEYVCESSDAGAAGNVPDAVTIVHRVNNWHDVCDRAEAAEARVAELERDARDAVELMLDAEKDRDSYRKALEAVTLRAREMARCRHIKKRKLEANAIAAHVAEVLR